MSLDDDMGPLLVSRRQYLILTAMAEGTDMFTAIEAVASTAIEHPEWDMEEEREWADWLSSAT